MLKIAKLQMSFGQNIILKDINLEALNGQLVIIEGKNGAGKSTLFNILSGVLLPKSGSILLNDLDLTKLSIKERAPYLAIVRQNPDSSCVSSFSLADNLALASLKGCNARLWPKKSPKDWQLEGMWDLDRPLKEYSGGQRQLLTFLMATLHKPDLLLLDEPTAALDEKAAKSLMEMVKSSLQKWQIPALMISHDHELNQRYGDAIYVLEGGELRGCFS